jgi:DNA-binding transcriptional regulator YdaS (Cro superfamily)
MPTPRKKNPAVERAIRAAGSQTALADKLGLPQSAISKRLHGQVPVTAEWAVEVERVLRGAVKRHDLRPDLWGGAS